jgi:hypothetical protein
MNEMSTRYFDGEGRAHMKECIRCALAWSVQHKIRRVVMFTGNGDGPHYAATQFLPQDDYQNLRLIAVSPPVGKTYFEDPRQPEKSRVVTAGIPPTMRDELSALGVRIVAGQLPFKEMHDGTGRMSSDWSRVTASMGIQGGGFALCIQAALMACDAGEVELGEAIVALSADTAVALWASRSDVFLSPFEGMLVDHIICRPANLSISKAKHRRYANVGGDSATAVAAPAAPTHRALPAAPAVRSGAVPPSQPSATAEPRAGSKQRKARRT